MKTVEQIREDHLLLAFEQAVFEYNTLLEKYEGQELNEQWQLALWQAARTVIMRGWAIARPIFKGAKFAGKGMLYPIIHPIRTTIYGILANMAVYNIAPVWYVDKVVDAVVWVVTLTGMSKEAAVALLSGVQAVAIPVASIFLAFFAKKQAEKILDKWYAKKGKNMHFDAKKKKMNKRDIATVTKLIKKYK